MPDLRVTWWDRLLLGLAPGWGVRRLRAKATAAVLAQSFDATGGGRRTSGWRRNASDANTANLGSITKLRELARDLRRNNGWARRAVEVIANNTVGWGIEAKAKGAPEEVIARAQELWMAWAHSPQCDYDGQMPLAGLAALVMETVAESGEALIVREAASSNDGLSIPLRIRVLEPDYLDAAKDGATANGNAVIQGIELDGRGRRVAYWLYEEHPGASGGAIMRSSIRRFGSRRVPADRVLHVYRMTRPGQMRGYSWLAAAIARLHDLADYDDAKLLQQKIAACFGAFVQDLDGNPEAIGEQDDSDPLLEKLQPGHISYLRPGQSVAFATPPSVADTGDFSKTHLRSIAAALGVTYEDLTGDYSQVTFSSARMARLSHWQNVHRWRWHMLIPQMLDGVWSWAMELAAAIEGWPVVPAAEWAPPPMPMLEPEKEGLAYQRLIRTGVMTLSQAIRELGEDPATHLEEYARDNQRLDELGIWLDSDPRRTSAAGLTQARSGAGVDSQDEP